MIKKPNLTPEMIKPDLKLYCYLGLVSKDLMRYNIEMYSIKSIETYKTLDIHSFLKEPFHYIGDWKLDNESNTFDSYPIPIASNSLSHVGKYYVEQSLYHCQTIDRLRHLLVGMRFDDRSMLDIYLCYRGLNVWVIIQQEYSFLKRQNKKRRTYLRIEWLFR